MTNDTLFSAMSGIKSDYVISAANWMTAAPQKDRRRTLRFTLIAAALLVLVTIPIAVIIANHYGITSPPPIPTITTDTTAAPTTTEKVYQSLYDIPGASVTDVESILGAPGPIDYQSPSSRVIESYIEWQPTIFIGSVESIESVLVPTGLYNSVFCLCVMSVNVTDRVANASSLPETVKLLAYYHYRVESDGTYTRLFGHSNILDDLQEKKDTVTKDYVYLGGESKSFLFILEKEPKRQSIPINGVFHSYTEYADYVQRLQCKLYQYYADGGYWKYDGKLVAEQRCWSKIPVDDLRVIDKKEE